MPHLPPIPERIIAFETRIQLQRLGWSLRKRGQGGVKRWQVYCSINGLVLAEYRTLTALAADLAVKLYYGRNYDGTKQPVYVHPDGSVHLEPAPFNAPRA